jgi:TIGR00046: RNA methyltransferase, RsmE family
MNASLLASKVIRLIWRRPKSCPSRRRRQGRSRWQPVS